MQSNWFKQQGRTLKKLRKQYFPGDTQADFAARVGVGLTTIQNLEAGKQGVAWGTVVKVLTLFNRHSELDELFDTKKETTQLKAGENW